MIPQANTETSWMIRSNFSLFISVEHRSANIGHDVVEFDTAVCAEADGEEEVSQEQQTSSRFAPPAKREERERVAESSGI